VGGNSGTQGTNTGDFITKSFPGLFGDTTDGTLGGQKQQDLVDLLSSELTNAFNPTQVGDTTDTNNFIRKISNTGLDSARTALPGVTARDTFTPRTTEREGSVARETFSPVANVGRETTNFDTALQDAISNTGSFSSPVNDALINSIISKTQGTAAARGLGAGTESSLAQAIAPTLQEAGQQNISNLLAAQGQELGSGVAQRGQDITSGVDIRGQDVSAGVAQRGQDLTSNVTQRGQDVKSLTDQLLGNIQSQTTQRGQDIRQLANNANIASDERGQDLGFRSAVLGAANAVGDRTSSTALGNQGNTIDAQNNALTSGVDLANLSLPKILSGVTQTGTTTSGGGK